MTTVLHAINAPMPTALADLPMVFAEMDPLELRDAWVPMVIDAARAQKVEDGSISVAQLAAALGAVRDSVSRECIRTFCARVKARLENRVRRRIADIERLTKRIGALEEENLHLRTQVYMPVPPPLAPDREPHTLPGEPTEPITFAQYRRQALFRAIELEGTLGGAAKRLGIGTRTANLWLKEWGLNAREARIHINHARFTGQPLSAVTVSL